jgi:hypothetical protein
MNYAQDRIDRRARNHDNSNNDGLWLDFVTSRLHNDHSLLANTLRDVGWIRQATFHYGQAWIQSPRSQRAAGDYAQMAELAGCPGVGVLALFHFSSNGSLANETGCAGETTDNIPSDWLQRQSRTGHCGCGSAECGQSACFVPMLDCQLTLDAMDTYVSNLSSRDMPTTHEVLSTLAKPAPLLCSSNDIPPLLQYWSNHALEPVLQLLLTKLLYLTLPHLAAEAVAHLQFDNQHQLAADFKSHWAYYVLITAVVLGERIKPHRRRTLEWYHVPVWDLLWGKDQRRNQSLPSCMTVTPTPLTMGSPQWTIGATAAPLHVVGDSHVLSMAWQTIVLPSGDQRLLIPVVVTGLKAWHTRPSTRFFTHALLHTSLHRCIGRTIVMSAGEIDCREGIGGEALEGYAQQVSDDHISHTVAEYVDALDLLSQRYDIQILVLPVAPHAHKSDKYGKAVGRARRRLVTQCWNLELKRAIVAKRARVYLLDYEAALLNPGYVLKPVYDADSTHMNSAFLPHLEEALQVCGLDETLL